MPMHLVKAERNPAFPPALIPPPRSCQRRVCGDSRSRRLLASRQDPRAGRGFLKRIRSTRDAAANLRVVGANGRVSLFKVKEHDSLTFHGTLMFRIRPEWRYDPIVFPGDPHFTQDVLCADGRQIYNFRSRWPFGACAPTEQPEQALVFDEAAMVVLAADAKSRGNGERDRGADSSRQSDRLRSARAPFRFRAPRGRRGAPGLRPPWAENGFCR